MLYILYTPPEKGGESMPHEELVRHINALLRDCKDVDLLEFIWKLLLQSV
jgi:hypothetical protein